MPMISIRIYCFLALLSALFGAEAAELDINGGITHWAFQELSRPQTPTESLPDRSRVRNPIDAFIIHAQDAAQVELASDAEPVALLRRVYLDLIGLPPTPEEQAAFLQNPSDEAYSSIVDDLLARPQHGERWARHWLDVVRYAETKGYERDDDRNFTWRYRDYVIDAFNRDMPYDQFVREQLAGDELPNAEHAQRIATTFLRLGPYDTIANSRDVAKFNQLDDILATTSQTFMGQTIQCARCHDHKFEPFSQVDYYRMLGAFDSLDIGSKGKPLKMSDAELAHNEAIEHEMMPHRSNLEACQTPILQRISANPMEGDKEMQVDKNLMKDLPQLMEAMSMPIAAREKKHHDLLNRYKGKIDDAMKKRATDEEMARLETIRQKISALEEQVVKPVEAWVFDDGTKKSMTRVKIRGDVKRDGEEVPFGIPVVFNQGALTTPEPTAAAHDEASGKTPIPEKRRLWLANWMTGAGSPLTARVMVNRVWQGHFGTGFMENANNFGIKAGAPTHPQLLEWLASDFRDNGWQLKRLHKLIVTSSTYRQSAAHDHPEADPDNKLFTRWPLHRLEAEIIRDSMLAVSGQLNLKSHGPSIYPPVNDVVVGTSASKGWKTSSEEEAARRSIYVYAKRAIPLPELALMDAPEAGESCDKRKVSTTAIQSLLMLNGRFSAEQAKHLAARVRDEAGEDRSAQIRHGFQRALCRPPTPEEMALSLKFFEGETDAQGVDPLLNFCLALFNSNEFLYPN
jgi:hypothetical protein